MLTFKIFIFIKFLKYKKIIFLFALLYTGNLLTIFKNHNNLLKIDHLQDMVFIATFFFRGLVNLHNFFLIAVRAGVRLLPCMEPLMYFKVDKLREGLVAVMARVRLFPCVDPHMFFKVR